MTNVGRDGAPFRAPMAPRRGSLHAATVAIGVLIVLACVARGVFPNADPSMSTWIGYVPDEGRWNQNARSLALFGTPADTALARLHLLLAPGYQAVNFAIFKIFGVDFWSARLFSALAGVALVLVPILMLRRLVPPIALAFGVVLLGFEGNLLAAGRLAFPEIPAALGTLLAFLVLVLGRKSRWVAFAAGTLAAIAVAMKATTVLVLPIFPLIVLFSFYEGRVGDRIARALAFVAGFLIWIVGGLAVALGLGLLSVDALLHMSARLAVFLSFTGPYITAMRFFDATDLEVRNLLLLGAWFAAWAWWYRDRRAPGRLCELYLASGAWACWWLIAWSGSTYLPGRYVIHFVVPATIHIMAGVALLRPDLPGAIAATLRARRGLPRAFVLAWLVVPSAIVLAAMSAGLFERIGVDVSRLVVRIGSIAAWTGVLVLAGGRACDRPTVIAWFLAFPLLLALSWLAGRELGWFARFWQSAEEPSPATAVAFVAVVALVALVLVRGVPMARVRGGYAWGAVGLLAAVLALQSVPALVTPTYSIRDASRDIERRLAPSMDVRAYNAESVFLGNRVRYSTLQRYDSSYDALVIFEHGTQPKGFIAGGHTAGLERAATYPVLHHPRYQTLEERYGPASIALFIRPR